MATIILAIILALRAFGNEPTTEATTDTGSVNTDLVNYCRTAIDNGPDDVCKGVLPADGFCLSAVDDTYVGAGDVPNSVAYACSDWFRGYGSECPEDAVCAVWQIRQTGRFDR